jgi:hypothetical protein
MRKVGLQDHRELARVGDVDGGQRLRRRLVGDPEHPPAVARQLDGHPLAAVAEAAELVMGEELHVLRRLIRHGHLPGRKIGQ